MQQRLKEAQITANSLGLAIVLCSSTPLLLLDAKSVIRAASASFCGTFGLDPTAVVGSELYALGSGEWDIRQLRSLLSASASGGLITDAYEVTLCRPGNVRDLVLHVQLLDYVGADEVLLFLAVNDVTEARRAERQKDDLIREKHYPASGTAASCGQQPPDYCQRPHTERAQGPVGGGLART